MKSNTKRANIPSDHFAAFAFSAADILFEIDEKGTILFADGAITGLLGSNIDAIIKTNISNLISQSHHKRFNAVIASIKEKNRIDAVNIKFNNNGEDIDFILSGVFMEHKGGRFYLSARCQSLIQDYDELRDDQEADGTISKQSFALRACKQIAESTAKGEEVNITIVDIPELQQIIDKLSPKSAEKLLNSIADYVKKKSVNNEASKILDRGSYSIITPGTMQKQELIDGIKAIARVQLKGVDLRVEATNIKTSSDEYPLTEQDLSNAVLYTINKFAENKGEEFNVKSLNESYEEMLDLTIESISEFRKTLKDDDYSLAFQPIVNLRTGVVHHHECLVRLHNSEKFNNPFEFITFGEQAGLINEFDLAITEKVLQMIRERKKTGQDVSLAINLSGRSLSSNLFLDTFLSLLRNYSDVRSNVIIEVTESFKIDNMQMANDFIQTLRKEGNLICLDDFGVGESSFSYLRHLQVDFVKIDGSYVRDSMQTDRGRKLLKAMASLCRNLDMMMIGEMVETQKEAEFLFESGVQYGQGYHIGKPSTDEIVLDTHNKQTKGYAGLFNVRRFRNDSDDDYGDSAISASL